MSAPRKRRWLFEPPASRGSVDRAVDEELAFHLETRVDALVAAGMSRAEARAAALREFGDLHQAHAELARIDRRRLGSERRAEWWEALLQDVRFAGRTLATHRGFTLAAVLTLALGIGATAAIFGVVDGLLIRPLPYPNHGRVVVVWSAARLGGEPQNDLPFSAPNFADLRARTRSFEALAAFQSWQLTLENDGGTELVPAARVSPELFGVLGVRPLLGRALAPEDDATGAENVVVLGHAIWQRRFGGDPLVIGRQITLSGERYTVVGVMPPEFAFPRGAELPSGLRFPARTQMWRALRFPEEQARNRGTWNLAVSGVLRPGVTLEQADADVAAAMRQIGAEHGMAEIELSGKVIPMREFSVRPVRSGLLLLLGAVVFVLLIACANVSNLLVARTAGRQRELAIRVALGAGRGRLVRQLMTENVMLALAGGAVGVAIALALKGSLLRLAPADLPRLDDIAIDGRVAGATMLVAIIIGALFGVLAAMQAGRGGGGGGTAGALREAGRSGAGGTGRARLRQALIVGEVALSLVLLVGASLLLQSFVRMHGVRTGFEPGGAITAQLIIPASTQESVDEQRPRWRAIVHDFLARVRSLPGVSAAGAVSSLPLSGAWEGTGFEIGGRAASSPDDRPRAQYAIVTPGYFDAMGIPLAAGRAIEEQDRVDAPGVVMVSEMAARRYWPGADPIGQRIRMFDTTWYTVVGVARDIRQRSLLMPVEPMVYIPLAQSPIWGPSVVARVSGDPAALVPALRRELEQVSPSAALTDARTLQDVVSASLAQRRFGLLVVGLFAASAFLLAAVGLYGVIAYGVGQRTQEIGLRMALGARQSDVLRMILRQGLLLAAAGLALGVAGALALSSLLERQLFEVSAADPFTYAAIAVLLLGTALLASWIPARRATRVDPVGALREE